MFRFVFPLTAVVVLLSGCQSLIKIALERATGQRLGYGASLCEQRQQQCPTEEYDRWASRWGDPQCSCRAREGDTLHLPETGP